MQAPRVPAALLDAVQRSGMPTSMAGFKGHPLYFLDKHITKYQVRLLPNTSPSIRCGCWPRALPLWPPLPRICCRRRRWLRNGPAAGPARLPSLSCDCAAGAAPRRQAAGHVQGASLLLCAGGLPCRPAMPCEPICTSLIREGCFATLKDTPAPMWLAPGTRWRPCGWPQGHAGAHVAGPRDTPAPMWLAPGTRRRPCGWTQGPVGPMWPQRPRRRLMQLAASGPLRRHSHAGHRTAHMLAACPHACTTGRARPAHQG